MQICAPTKAGDSELSDTAEWMIAWVTRMSQACSGRRTPLCLWCGAPGTGEVLLGCHWKQNSKAGQWNCSWNLCRWEKSPRSISHSLQTALEMQYSRKMLVLSILWSLFVLVHCSKISWGSSACSFCWTVKCCKMYLQTEIFLGQCSLQGSSCFPSHHPLLLYLFLLFLSAAFSGQQFEICCQSDG